MPKKKKGKKAKVNLDSFLDIMTCLLGVLVLIIILTSIDASQIKMIVPTPMAHLSTKRPVFVECRGNLLYFVDIAQIRKALDDELARIEKEAAGDRDKMLQMMSSAVLDTDNYKLDLSFALAGQNLLIPKPDAKGLSLDDVTVDTLLMKTVQTGGWYEKLLSEVNKEEDMITFLVRDDSYAIFKKARGFAWMNGIECSYELLDVTDPIKLGLGGEASLAQ
ncbi:MAG: hypothetical protein AB7T27_04895 [Kiritimatiellia bacterium]